MVYRRNSKFPHVVRNRFSRSKYAGLALSCYLYGR